MINVVVLSIMDIAKAFGARKILVKLPEESDILALLLALSEQYGDEFRKLIFSKDEFLQDRIVIMLNGRSILAYDGIRCKLNDNDEVLIMPLIAGG